jgi:hypothetical protein
LNIFLDNDEKETQILSAAAATPFYTPEVYYSSVVLDPGAIFTA